METNEVDDLTFDYAPEELGIDTKHAAKIKEIKQLRPLNSKQPWGIFWVNFERKNLPMVVLRRILGNLIIKRRTSARKADRPSWHLNDLLFISSYGEEEHRTISFAHFTEDPGTDELPVLRVLGWDDQNSKMHLERVANRLHSHFRWPSESDDVDAWRKRWSESFTDRYREAIRSADELIPRLANLAANIRRRVRDVLDAETKNGPMRRLFTAVQKILIHDMDEDAFADMYAQTVAYGLLSARFSRPAGITAQNLIQLTAVSNPFLENLLENLFRLNRGKFHFDVDEVGINDVLDLLRNTNIDAIKAAFSDKNPAEDPVIRFYEGFLKEYDPEQRIKRGIFFTPRSVVSYIVRSVHELLKTEFGLEDGLASTVTWGEMEKQNPGLMRPTIRGKNTKSGKLEDIPVSENEPFVQILDPATGTGTFLFECIGVIERTMKDKWCRELGKESWNAPEILNRWREYVPKHLLPRLYGYELMMAPYSIAHLKLALKLGETGYRFQEGDRLHIYLTNSLEPPSQLADTRLADLFTTIATEAQKVNEVKANKRFTVVIGNSPYAGMSANRSFDTEGNATFIGKLIENYRRIDGMLLGERNPKMLQDDYVKFIRTAEWLIDKTSIGVFGYITNHAYIDNPTFRGMRWSLAQTFDTIHVLNLHGNVRRKEQPPMGGEDHNVFDIQQGVSILLCAKTSCSNRNSIQYQDLWGTRVSKNDYLKQHVVHETNWHRLYISSPFYLFTPQNTDLLEEYNLGMRITDVFPLHSVGIDTGRDGLTIQWTEKDVENVINDFSSLSVEKARAEYELGDDTMEWKVEWAQRDLKDSQLSKTHVRPILYRPFDVRCTYYTGRTRGFHCRPRSAVMRLMLGGNNLALITVRQQSQDGKPWTLVGVTDKITERCAISNKTKEANYLFPLYSLGSKLDRQSSFDFSTQSTPNLGPEFLAALAQNLNLEQTKPHSLPKGVTAEMPLHYCYAVLHSPTYRTRYAEFLKIDFPRLPLTSNLELFRALGNLGGELVALHLMESPRLEKPITKYIGTGNNEVVKVRYADQTVWVNDAQGFLGVPEEAWNFHIGGYQVCEKWLKDRKGRQLSKEDITHYQKIVIALTETIRIMAEIDKVIDTHGGWPGAFTSDVVQASEI